jgi:hypothetical protein
LVHFCHRAQHRHLARQPAALTFRQLMMHCGVWERSSTAPRMTAPSLGRHTEEGFRAIRRRRGVNLRGGARTRSQVGRSGEALDNTVHDEARQVSSSSVGNPRSGPRVMRSAVPRTADQQSHSAPWRRSTGSKGLAAWEYAFGSLTLSMGHVFLTASVDLFVWPAVILAVMRALLRGRPWWWLVAGTIAALSLYNKFLIVMLLAALAIGLLALGPRRAVWSPWVLGGVVLALVAGLPNIIYQVANGWPQLTMGAALSAHNAGSVRTLMWPFLLLMLGPPLVPFWVAGLVACSVAVTGGPSAGSVVGAVISLPVIPLGVLGQTPIPGINSATPDQVGWPA